MTTHPPIQAKDDVYAACKHDEMERLGYGKIADGFVAWNNVCRKSIEQQMQLLL